MKYFQNKQFLFSVLWSLLFLIASLVINFYAGLYAAHSASNSVTDIILSNTQVWNVDGIFIYGAVLFWVFVGVIAVIRPHQIPFLLKSITLFILIRSVFITLTHVGPFPTQIPLTTEWTLSKFTSGYDLFFSAHTGLPFLMSLVFWNHKYLYWFFLAASIFFGVIVLLGHLHYSIDVLAAFFITYSIFHLAELFFKKDREMFEKGLPYKEI